jgi:hypothetical protein
MSGIQQGDFFTQRWAPRNHVRFEGWPPASMEEVRRAREYYLHTYRSMKQGFEGEGDHGGGEFEGEGAPAPRPLHQFSEAALHEVGAIREHYLEVSSSAQAAQRELGQQCNRHTVEKMREHAASLRQGYERQIDGRLELCATERRSQYSNQALCDIDAAVQSLASLQQSLGRLQQPVDCRGGALLAMDATRAQPYLDGVQRLVETAFAVQASGTAFLQRKAPQRCTAPQDIPVGCGVGSSSGNDSDRAARPRYSLAVEEPPFLMLPPEVRVRVALWLDPDDLASLDISCSTAGVEVAEAVQQQHAAIGLPPCGKSWPWVAKHATVSRGTILFAVNPVVPHFTGTEDWFRMKRTTKMVRTVGPALAPLFWLTTYLCVLCRACRRVSSTAMRQLSNMISAQSAFSLTAAALEYTKLPNQ